MGRNLYPKAPDMRQASTQGLRDGELYWIIENGVRLTSMSCVSRLVQRCDEAGARPESLGGRTGIYPHASGLLKSGERG